MAQFLVLPSPVGELAVRMEQSALTGLFLRHQRYAPALPWDTLEEADEKKKDEMREKMEQIASRIQRDPGKIFPSPGVWIRFHIMRIFQRRKKEADIDQRYWAEQGWLGRKRPWKET